MEILESYTAGYVGTNVSPHNATARFSITPPGTRRYHVGQILLYLYRTEEATAPGVSRAYLQIERSTGEVFPTALASLYGTSVGIQDVVNMTLDITLQPGDALRVYTMDTSTGGAISYWIAVNYDAIP